MADIIVIGRRLGGGASFWGWGFDQNGGWLDSPQLFPVEEGSGGGGVDWENDLHEIHNALCGTRKDAALSIAETIKATDDTGSPNNWKKYEYGAVIENRGPDRIGAFRDRVHTDWQPGWVNIGAPPNDPDSIEGFVHNHPSDSLHVADKNFVSYPSVDDIDRFSQLVEDGKITTAASIFIVDPYGNTREFVSSSLAYFKDLSRDAKMDGEGLPTPLTSDGTCRPL